MSSRFLMISLDKEDQKRLEAITARIKGVSTPEGAVKWALQNCPLPAASKKAEMIKVRVIEPEKSSASITPVFNPNAKSLPLGTHTTAVYPIPMKRLAKLEHTVMIESRTLERLVPNAKSRLKLFGDDLI
jgi:hypothetical protein